MVDLSLEAADGGISSAVRFFSAIIRPCLSGLALIDGGTIWHQQIAPLALFDTVRNKDRVKVTSRWPIDRRQPADLLLILRYHLDQAWAQHAPSETRPSLSIPQAWHHPQNLRASIRAQQTIPARRQTLGHEYLDPQNCRCRVLIRRAYFELIVTAPVLHIVRPIFSCGNLPADNHRCKIACVGCRALEQAACCNWQ